MKPSKILDYKLIEEMASQLCTQKNIARAVGFSPTWFCERKHNDPELVEALERGFAKARREMLEAQLDLAINDKNVAMLIHLGKCYCGQRGG